MAGPHAAERTWLDLVYITTGGALYGRPRYPPRDADRPIEPLSAYGLSKWVAERYLAQVLGPRHAVIILRLANAYGPRQRIDLEAGVIAIFIARLRRGLPLDVDGNGRRTRDFVYVTDVADAVRRAMARDEPLTVNVASGRSTSIDEVIGVLERVSGLRPTVRHGVPPGAGHHPQPSRPATGPGAARLAGDGRISRKASAWLGRPRADMDRRRRG